MERHRPVREPRTEPESVADLAVALREADCVVIVTAHSAYDWAAVNMAATSVVDTLAAMPRKTAVPARQTR